MLLPLYRNVRILYAFQETKVTHEHSLMHAIDSLVQEEGTEGEMEEARGGKDEFLGLVGRMLTQNGASCVAYRSKLFGLQ